MRLQLGLVYWAYGVMHIVVVTIRSSTNVKKNVWHSCDNGKAKIMFI